jgi:hypothetical protein
MPGILQGYPMSTGNRRMSVLELGGLPSSYTTVTNGSPPTGGVAITAQQFGLKYLDYVVCASTDDGQYGAEYTPCVQGKLPVKSGVLMFYVTNTGAQCTGGTNLSSRTLRLVAYGLD